MVVIVCKASLEPLELPYLETTHFVVVKTNTLERPFNFVFAYFQFLHYIGAYLDHLQNILAKLKGQMVMVSMDASALKGLVLR